MTDILRAGTFTLARTVKRLGYGAICARTYLAAAELARRRRGGAGPYRRALSPA